MLSVERASIRPFGPTQHERVTQIPPCPLVKGGYSSSPPSLRAYDVTPGLSLAVEHGRQAAMPPSRKTGKNQRNPIICVNLRFSGCSRERGSPGL